MVTYRNPLLIVSVLMIIGAILRLKGLGTWDFAIDEYYFAKSILSITENGLPNFPTGEGYYTRGILIQYITVPFTFLFQNTEFALRIVPVVLNLLAIPAIYLIGKRMHSVKVGILTVLFFSLSLWEIEFARFARMYVPFQFVFMWEVYFLIKYFQEGRVRELNYIIYLTVIGSLVYAGSIFMVVALLFALIYKKPENFSTYLIISIFTLISIVFYYKIDFRNAAPNIDVVTTSTTLAQKLPIYLPKFVFLEWDVGVVAWAIYICTLFITLIVLNKIGFIRMFQAFNFFPKLAFVGFVISLFSNQLMMAGLLIPLILILGNFKPENDIFYKTSVSLFILLLTWGVYWTFFALIRTDLGLSGLFEYYLNYPRIKNVIAWPWFKAMPVHSLILFSSLIAYFFILLIRKFDRGSEAAGFIFTLFLVLVMATSLLKTNYHTTRYTFYLYPLILIFFSTAIVSFDEMINIRILKNKITVAFTLLLLFLSETFYIDHLLNIDDQKYNYRVAYNQYRADLYFLRLDFRSVANYIDINFQPGDQIISFIPAIDQYLDHDIDYMYLRKGKSVDVLSCGGKCFLWNGVPTIKGYEQLFTHINNTKGYAWVIANLKRYYPVSDEERQLLELNSDKIAYINFDKSLAVYKFKALSKN